MSVYELGSSSMVQTNINFWVNPDRIVAMFFASDDSVLQIRLDWGEIRNVDPEFEIPLFQHCFSHAYQHPKRLGHKRNGVRV